tara:strand:- start:287 stop:412 length:126 start_codon:yes stop_codon:yes gene_type:complete
MNKSKLYEWLIEHQCPFEWDVDVDSYDEQKSCKLIFTEKED